MALKALECRKCGHSWIPREGELPKVCPRCKSYAWNDEQKGKEEKKV
jgi:predicted Zn-ribbon and HTH transcriptional regulator